MKSLGFLLLIVAGGGVGFFRARSLRRRVAGLDSMHRLVIWLMREVRYTAAPMGDMLKAAASLDAFSALPFLDKIANRHVSWSLALEESRKAFGFTDEDVEQIVRFGEGLGKSDLTGQLEHGAFYAEKLEESCCEARRVAKEKGHVEQVLWPSAAAMIALLLI